MKRILTTFVLLLTLLLMSSGAAIAGSGISGPESPPYEPPPSDPADGGDMVFGANGDPTDGMGGDRSTADADSWGIEGDEILDFDDLVDWLLYTFWLASL